MEYRIAICDDEDVEIKYLMSLVSKWGEKRKDIIRIDVFKSAESFLFHYEDGAIYDILILDIEMRGMNGIELAREVRDSDRRVQIIFVTAYSDFISEGYDVSALHYLLKPVSNTKLHEILEKAVSNLNKERKYEVFHINGDAIRVPVENIICVEAVAHSVFVTTMIEKYQLGESISEMEKILGEGFVRCHRSYLVGLKYVKRITKTAVITDLGVEIPLSRRKYAEVNQAFIQYYKGEDYGSF